MKNFYILVLFLLFSSLCSSQVKLPKLVGDHMVLQRDVEIPIWGWAAVGEKVTITFNNKNYKTKTGKDGIWAVNLKAIKAGGPYEMVIKGKNTIRINDILIGDVWLASGQSNMEWVLKADGNNYEKEIADANFPKIRLFTVIKNASSAPKTDVSSNGWQLCSSKTISDFSAVAYFFGKDLYHKLNIPIGLIHSSWGGTPAEAWTDFNTVKQFPRYKSDAELLANNSLDLEKVLEEYDSEMSLWKKEYSEDRGYQKNGKTWADLDVNITDWKTMSLPAYWEQPTILPNFDGVVWFRKDFNLSQEESQQVIKLHLANIDDEDITFVNGVEIGKTIGHTFLREYSIPKNILKVGRNNITVRVTDNQGGGGIYGDPELFFIEKEENKESLAGIWSYKTAVDISKMPKNPLNSRPKDMPTALFNGMIAPLTPYAIKGAIWYQGESNASRAYEYEELFPSMISGWREKWGYNFPFLFVQLANYMFDKEQPADYEWAELRDAQTKTLKLPNTGMAVAIDIGNPNDIHPRNKLDVGNRLSLAALKVAYDEDIVYSGPQFQSMKIQGDKIRIAFSNIGSGLDVRDKYGYVKGFAIAGADKKFMWAKGYLDGNDIVLYNETIKKPEAIRYNWSNNPEGNIYNKEGLPAVPFRTDNYRGITEGK